MPNVLQASSCTLRTKLDVGSGLGSSVTGGGFGGASADALASVTSSESGTEDFDVEAAATVSVLASFSGGLGVGSGGATIFGQASATLMRIPDANTNSETSKAFARACSLNSPTEAPFRFRQE